LQAIDAGIGGKKKVSESVIGRSKTIKYIFRNMFEIIAKRTHKRMQTKIHISFDILVMSFQ